MILISAVTQHLAMFSKILFTVAFVMWMKLTYVGPSSYLDGWPSSGGYTGSVCTLPGQLMTCIPPGSLSRVPALVGVRVGMSLVPGVIPYGMWVPVAMTLVANCYSPFTLPHLYQFFLFLAGAAHQTRLGDQWRPPDLLVDAFGVSMSSPVFKYGHLATLDSMIPVSSMEEAHTHTHSFNGHFSGTTQVSQYQKDKTNLDFTEARDSEWQWHQLSHMQVHLAPVRQPHHWPSCRPTNSVKALKA